MKNKFDYPIYKAQGRLEKGSMYGNYDTFDNSLNSKKRTIYNYFMTNNHLNIFMYISFLGFLLSIYLLFLFNIPLNNTGGSSIYIYEKLGNNASHKLSIFLSAIVSSFFIGFKQLDYLKRTNSTQITFLTILLFNFITIFAIFYYSHAILFDYFGFNN